MPHSTTTLLKQVGLAMIGQALPQTSVLNSMARDMRLGMIAAVVTGVLSGACILLACFGLYHLMLREGFAPDTAIMLGAGVVLLLAVISGVMAEKYLSSVSKAKKKLSPCVQKEQVSGALEKTLSAFLDGLLDTDASVTVRRRKSDDAPILKEKPMGDMHVTAEMTKH